MAIDNIPTRAARITILFLVMPAIVARLAQTTSTCLPSRRTISLARICRLMDARGPVYGNAPLGHDQCESVASSPENAMLRPFVPERPQPRWFKPYFLL